MDKLTEIVDRNIVKVDQIFFRRSFFADFFPPKIFVTNVSGLSYRAPAHSGQSMICRFFLTM